MKNVLKILSVFIIFLTLNSCQKEASFGEGVAPSSENNLDGLNFSPEAVCTWNIKVKGFRFDEDSPIFTEGGSSTSVTINVIKGDGTRIPVMANIIISEANPEQIQNGIDFISGGSNGVAAIEVSFNGDIQVSVEVETGNTNRTLGFSPNRRCRTPRPRPLVLSPQICFNVPTQKTETRGVAFCDFEP